MTVTHYAPRIRRFRLGPWKRRLVAMALFTTGMAGLGAGAVWALSVSFGLSGQVRPEQGLAGSALAGAGCCLIAAAYWTLADQGTQEEKR